MVATLTDPNTQTGYYYRVLGRWAHEDKDAARTWIAENANTLPEAVVKRMLK